MPACKIVMSVLFVLALCGSAEAWYKQVAGSSYHSVGRASGLLSRVRSSTTFDRRGTHVEPLQTLLPETKALRFSLKTMPSCMRDIAPNLYSCQLFSGDMTTFRCKVVIFFSLE